MERWERAADAQVELAEYFGSDRGQSDADQFFRIHFAREDVAQPYPITIRTQDGEELDMSYGQQVWLNLRVAEPIFISEEMMDLVEHAAPTFQQEPLLIEDLITPSGFVYFPRPMITRDRHDKTLAYRALSWYPMQTSDDPFPTAGNVNYSGVMFTFYSHVDDDDDYIEGFREAVAGTGNPWAIVHSSVAWFGKTPMPTIDDPSYTAADRASILSYYQPVHAMLRLMQQYISERSSYRPARSTRRRAIRAQMPEHDVTVIRLRRPRSKGEPTEGKHVEWTHQWLVGPHWRNQYFPSLKANRQIYIAPYIKGPEDKPLRIREKRVFEFVR